VIAPSKTHDEQFRGWFAKCQRFGTSPEQMAGTLRYGFIRDPRPLLPTLSFPTLVLHQTGNRYIEVGAGRYLTEHIPGAKYVELPGEDHLFYVGDTDALRR
jgi:pimeloyl-ACP methyl ester carboxylesterase